MTGNSSTTALPPFLAPTYFFMKFNTAWKFMAICIVYTVDKKNKNNIIGCTWFPENIFFSTYIFKKFKHRTESHGYTVRMKWEKRVK